MRVEDLTRALAARGDASDGTVWGPLRPKTFISKHLIPYSNEDKTVALITRSAVDEAHAAYDAWLDGLTTPVDIVSLRVHAPESTPVGAFSTHGFHPAECCTIYVQYRLPVRR